MHLRAILFLLILTAPTFAQHLPGTQPLESKDDLARVMLDGIDRYLTKQTTASVEQRAAHWKHDFSSVDAYIRSVEPMRDLFKKRIGVVDARVPVKDIQLVATAGKSGLLAETAAYKIYQVRWPVLAGIEGEGLLLEPNLPPRGQIVVLPDADQTPEMLAGLEGKLENPWASGLVQNGFRVVVPASTDRRDTWSGNAKINRMTNQTHREFIYRMSYEMGRHVIGYEVQRALAVVDWFARDPMHPPIGIMGHGEVGMLALYAAACDPRIDAAYVSGYFGPRERVDQEPIYRNVWGLLKDFGDGELLDLIVPRSLIVVEAEVKVSDAPAAKPGRAGAAPGILKAPTHRETQSELERGLAKFPALKKLPRQPIVAFAKDKASEAFTQFRNQVQGMRVSYAAPQPDAVKLLPDGEERSRRQFDQLVSFTQNLQRDAVTQRQRHVWDKLDTKNLDAFEKSQEPVRDNFWQEVMGKLPKPKMPMNARTRLAFETPKWKAYDVVLDVYEDVISYGILLVPTDLKPGEKRPCVVCQHGLEGRPIDVVNPKEKTRFYNSFGAHLADKGFIVFAPQCPYIFKNDFRQVVRKANPLGLTLYSFIIRQHERILEFLNTLPFVDGKRIAYYGLSYGGKVAMRIPAILAGYAAVICSGDFNEWIWKNVTIDWGSSYMFTGEYEIYEFNLGNTFNYAEMAALICPRPFMVERGHNDGVGLDEYVAFEFAKVRRLYAKLGIADRTEIEFFQGGHECHLVGTVAFLKKHLDWPK